jgi:hypothetical protein
VGTFGVLFGSESLGKTRYISTTTPVIFAVDGVDGIKPVKVAEVITSVE